jgi:transcription elongation GreA/GreB family factor
MATYVFTRQGYAALLELIFKIQKGLDRAIDTKAEGGAGQDGWHDEVYKLGVVEEMTWSRRLGDLQRLKTDAQIIDPIEQNKVIGLGNGVVIEYEDGSTFGFLLDGYAVEPSDERVSIQSPLGSAITDAKEGESRIFEANGRKIVVRIKKILAPSMAKLALKI